MSEQYFTNDSCKDTIQMAVAESTLWVAEAVNVEYMQGRQSSENKSEHTLSSEQRMKAQDIFKYNKEQELMW